MIITIDTGEGNQSNYLISNVILTTCNCTNDCLRVFEFQWLAALKKVSCDIAIYWMLKSLVLVTHSDGKCIPDGKD